MRKLIALFIMLYLLLYSSFIVNGAVEKNKTVKNNNNTINNTLLDEDSNKLLYNNGTPKISLDAESNKLLLNDDAFNLLNSYYSNKKTEEDILSDWNNGSSIFNSIDFSNMGDSLSNFDDEDGFLNFNFALMASSLSTYQQNTSLDKMDPNSKVFESGYSQNIKSYFNNTFGDLSKKKDLSLSELPNISTYTKQADKKRNAGMNSFLKSSDYKKVNSAISVGNIFSIAKSQLSGNGIYSLSSIDSLQNDISGAANSLDDKTKKQQSGSYLAAESEAADNYYQNQETQNTNSIGTYNAYSSKIKRSYLKTLGEDPNKVKKEIASVDLLKSTTDDFDSEKYGSTITEKSKKWGKYSKIISNLGNKKFEKEWENSDNNEEILFSYLNRNGNDKVVDEFLTDIEKQGGTQAKEIYKSKGVEGLADYLNDNNLDSKKTYGDKMKN